MAARLGQRFAPRALIRDDQKQRLRARQAFQRLGFSRVRTVYESKPPDQLCVVCADIHPIEDFKGLRECAHNPDVCRECIGQWLDVEVGNIDVARIPCPSTECSAVFAYEDVHDFAPAEVFDRYDKLTLQTFLRNHPDFRYCIGLGCPFGQLHDAEDGNIFICATCGHCSCVNHNIAFQSGETCEQYDTRKAREDKAISEMNKATMDLLEKETKKCPGCGYRIEKTRGCDRVTCSQCQFQFCYQCSASYNGEGGIRSMGNIAHADDCAHHFDNLPSNPFAVYGMARFGSASSSFGGAFGSATFGTGSSASGLGAIDYIDDEDITDDEDVTDDEDITDDEDNSSISPESDVYPPYIRAVTNTSASGDATEAKEKQEAVEKSTAKETSPAAARDPSDHDKASEKHSSAVPNAAHQAPIPRSNDTSNQATEPASRMHTSADPTIVASIMARKRRRYPWMGQSAVEQMSGSLGSLSVNSPADQSSVDKSRKG